MKKKIGLIFIIILVFSAPLFAQVGFDDLIIFDFTNQEIREILFAFSAYAGISIIGDDTVTGTASFQFIGTNFDQAFDSFLMSNRLFVERTDDLWIVTRVLITVTDDRIIIDSFDATPSQLVDRLTRRTNTTILQDMLPTTRLSLHLETATPGEAVELFMRPFADYSVEIAENFVHIRRMPSDPFGAMLVSGFVSINEEDGFFDVDIDRGRLGEVLDRLFQIADKEYLSFIRPDQVVERVRFSGRDFHDSLGIILEQGGGEYREINDLFYIFPMQQGEIITNLRNEGKSWRPFMTRFRLIPEVLPHIQARFSGLQTVSLPDNNTMLAFIFDDMVDDIQYFIQTIDAPSRSEGVRLRYIRTEDLFRSLPPSARREDLVDAGDGSTLFFVGSDERRALFMRDLELIDRPRPRIRYDLFIIQVQDSTNFNWNTHAEARFIRPGDRTMVTGQFGNLLNLNFDIITIFGYQFAARLNAAISENQASVFADTTLFGLSGQEIRFQNTNTFRYRDSNICPDTGRPIFSGVTREIVSGLILEIEGWASGDGMITTRVTATVSKRGADTSAMAGNPPPTSEKILTTQVRARSGETVILSGLRQNDSTIVQQRMPVISRIPLLGWLFRSRNSTTEDSQMIIYLVPHLDIGNEGRAVRGLNTASIFNRFVEPYL